MRQFLLLVSAVLVANISVAQQSRVFFRVPANHSRMLNGLLGQTNTPGSAKTTAGVPSERLIAQSTRDSTFTILSDSLYLGYSGSHFSNYDYNTMIYAYNYPYNSSPVFNNNRGIFGKPQVLYDTLMRWTIDPNTLTFGYYESAYATYETNMNIISYFDIFADSSINPNMRYVNKFNTAKSIDSGYGYIWKSGSSINAFKQYYTYNAANKLTKDSIYEYHLGVWRLGSKTDYTYNASNDLVQIDNYTNTTDTSFLLPLIEQYKYVNTYDVSHRLQSVASSYFNGTSLAPYILDSFTYSGSIAYHNTWKEHQWDPINGYWAPMFYMHKYISSTTGLPDSVYIDGFDSILNAWVPQSRYLMSYDAAKNPVKLYDYEDNFGSYFRKPVFITTYYYGSYLNTIGTKNVASVNSKVKIFPNPATSEITITGLDVPANTPLSVSLMNAGGQLVNRTGLAWQEGTCLSMADLVPGVYFVVIQDAAGNLLHRQSLVKQ